MKTYAIVAAIAVGTLATALAKPTGLPAGWLQTGDATTCDGRVVPMEGAPSPKVFALDCQPGTQGFVTLMQQVSASDDAGRRVRLSAQVHGDQLAAWGGLWLRADSGRQMGTAFDNMADRALRGSFGWQPAEVVLDIPADATALSFGMLLDGAGRMQATQFQLAVVSTGTATTGQGAAQALPRQAGNLTPP